MEIAALLNKMAVFILLMLIGYILATRGVIGKDFNRSASKLVIDVFMVGTILNAVLSPSGDISLGSLKEILILTFITMFLGFLISMLICRFIHLPSDRAPVYEILMALGNTMFIALPIAGSLYGAYAIFIVSVSCIPFNVMLYSYGVWRMKGGGTGKGIRFREMLSVPMITTFLGILLLILNVPVPKAASELFSALGGATMPMSMLVIGSSLGSVSLLDAFRDRQLVLLSLVKLILIPLVTWAVCRLITKDTVLLMTCMIIAASPSAIIVSVLGIQYGQDAVFSSEAVQHSTICSMITIPLLIRVLSMFC